MKPFPSSDRDDLLRQWLLEGREIQEIAAEEGVTRQAVAKRIRKALRRYEPEARKYIERAKSRVEEQGHTRLATTYGPLKRAVILRFARDILTKEEGFVFFGDRVYSKEWLDRQADAIRRAAERKGLPLKLEGPARAFPKKNPYGLVISGKPPVLYGVGVTKRRHVGAGRNLALYAMAYGKPFRLDEIPEIFPDFVQRFPASETLSVESMLRHGVVYFDLGRFIHVDALMDMLEADERGRAVLKVLKRCGEIVGDNTMSIREFLDEVERRAGGLPEGIGRFALIEVARRFGGCEARLLRGWIRRSEKGRCET